MLGTILWAASVNLQVRYVIFIKRDKIKTTNSASMRVCLSSHIFLGVTPLMIIYSEGLSRFKVIKYSAEL